jgi:hypothetical protein
VQLFNNRFRSPLDALENGSVILALAGVIKLGSAFNYGQCTLWVPLELLGENVNFFAANL